MAINEPQRRVKILVPHEARAGHSRSCQPAAPLVPSGLTIGFQGKAVEGGRQWGEVWKGVAAMRAWPGQRQGNHPAHTRSLCLHPGSLSWLALVHKPFLPAQGRVKIGEGAKLLQRNWGSGVTGCLTHARGHLSALKMCVTDARWSVTDQS